MTKFTVSYDRGHSRVLLDRSLEWDINYKPGARVVMHDISQRRLERSHVLSN